MWCGVRMRRSGHKSKGGRTPSDYWTLEHVIPLSCGGADTFANTSLACHACNRSRDGLSLPPGAAGQEMEI